MGFCKSLTGQRQKDHWGGGFRFELLGNEWWGGGVAGEAAEFRRAFLPSAELAGDWIKHSFPRTRRIPV